MSAEIMQRIEELNQTNNSQEVGWEQYDQEKAVEDAAKRQEEASNTREQQLEEANKLKQKLLVESFIREKFEAKECIEPIDSVDTVIKFSDLVEMLKKSAEEEWKLDVKENIENRKVDDQRIYHLKAYEELSKKWFILPSDVRDYYKSANNEPVHHLGVDYNINAWTGVKAIYKWKVVTSWFTGEKWTGKSSLWHMVVLEHEAELPDGTKKKFYSLYGHLGSENLPAEWSYVEKWTEIWKVWKWFQEENWFWNEHLHFQIMEDKDSARWFSEESWKENYDVLWIFGKSIN